MILEFFSSFLLGLLTPLTAVCVLPLYPGFLAYLSSKLSNDKSKSFIPVLGLLVVLGVLIFMFLLGLVFTTILGSSLTNVIGIVSPIAFSILVIFSIFLIFNIDVGKYLPQYHAPVLQNPYLSALVFGFFFGAIVIPCNPLFIAALFTKAITDMNFAISMLHFVAFGVGIGFPLLVFALLSGAASSIVINFLVARKRIINFVAGVIMLLISLYYLIVVFRVFG